MIQEYVILCGEDEHYLRNLTDYLIARRTLGCFYLCCRPEELAEECRDRQIPMLILEGERIPDAIPEGIPVLRMKEPGAGGSEPGVIEKYRSAKEIAGIIELEFYRFHKSEVPKVDFFGSYNLFLLAESREMLLSKLRARKGKGVLLVNLQEFHPLPGEGYGSITELVLYDCSRDYHPEVPPLKSMEDGIYGIEGLACLEDYREIEGTEMFRMLAVYADINGLSEVWIDFGTNVSASFRLFSHCREIWIPGLLPGDTRPEWEEFTHFMECRKDVCQLPALMPLDWEEGSIERTAYERSGFYTRRTEPRTGVPLS